MADIITGNPYEGMKRCIVNPDLTVAYFCDPNDSSKKADGTTIDWAQVESLGQNLMVQIPKFYAVKKWVPAKSTWVFGASYEPIATADIALNDWEVHPAFFKDLTVACNKTCKPIEVPFRYVGVYGGWVDSASRLRSLPYKGTSGFTNSSTTALDPYLIKASNMGVGFSPIDWLTHQAIAHLYLCEYGNPDYFKIFPGISGYYPAGATMTATGNHLALGNTSGTCVSPAANGTSMASYRGIADIFWAHHLVGLIITNECYKNGAGELVNTGRTAFVITRGDYNSNVPVNMLGSDMNSTSNPYIAGAVVNFAEDISGSTVQGDLCPNLIAGFIPSLVKPSTSRSFKDAIRTGVIAGQACVATGRGFGMFGVNTTGNRMTGWGITRLCI